MSVLFLALGISTLFNNVHGTFLSHTNDAATFFYNDNAYSSRTLPQPPFLFTPPPLKQTSSSCLLLLRFQRKRRRSSLQWLSFSQRSSTNSKTTSRTTAMSLSASSKDPKLDTVHTTHRTTTTTPTTTMNIYSSDPLVYTVPNLLSDMECQDLCHYVNNLEQKKKNGTQRVMTRSNPPELSLNIAKLWPLPFLSLAAGIPSLYHLFLQDPSSSSSFVDHTLTAITTTTTTTNAGDTVFSPSMEQIWNTVLPPMIMAFLLSIGLAYGIVLPLLRRMSMSSSS